MSRLNDKTAVVTGGSRGIGKAICSKLAENVANVAFVFKTNEEKADITVKELSRLDSEISVYRSKRIN